MTATSRFLPSRRGPAALLALIVVVLLADVAAVRGLPAPVRHVTRPLSAGPQCDRTTTVLAAPARPAGTPVAGSCAAAPRPAPKPTAAPAVAPFVSQPIPPVGRWAVLVGIQVYGGNTHPTYGGRGDIEAVRTALLRSGWRDDHILTLVDGQASGQAIRNAMSWLADRSGPQTFSLFHFSGHVCVVSRGPCRAGHTYLWSQDNQFLSESVVASVLGRVQGRAWFDFAGCEAGALDAGLSSPNRLVTGSSQGSETAYEEPTWHESVWSGLVWDRGFLQGQAGAPPLQATIGQMVDFGKAAAAQITATQSAGTQHPYVAGGDLSQTLYAPRS